LTTLLPPTSGFAFIAGYEIVRQPGEVRRHIGYVPQTLSADSALTGLENMMLSAGLYGIPLRQQTSRAAEALATMGLSDVAQRLAGQYSGGMIRRLEIAQSILHRPAVLFMDEPTVGLDPTARKNVWSHLLELRKAIQTTMLITTHYMKEAEEHCDRIAIIAGGRILAIGTPAELRARADGSESLEDAFEYLVGLKSENEIQKGYDRVGSDRRAAQQHG
jgi:ABC-2 type transport system ATP-binding protein